jgi:hypothetical protein
MTNTSGPIRGQVRVKGYRRVTHGTYRVDDGSDRLGQWMAELAAWLLVLPEDAAFTHVTAARLLGWWMPQLPEQVPVFASTTALDYPRRAGLSCARLGRCGPTALVNGLPVDTPAEILLRASRDLGLLDVVVLLDSAIRLYGLALLDEVDAILRTRRPGVRRLRAARALTDHRSESAWETLLRLFHVAIEAEVEPQLSVFDEGGRFVARGDLWLVGTPFLHEYDGAVHRSGPQQAVDLRRARELTHTAYVRRGYTADDLLNHPAAVMRDVDTALDRESAPSRLARWRRWVSESTYSQEGRRRLQNRWWRLTAVNDWAETT